MHQKRMPRRPLPENLARANAKRSVVRSAVEHVFAGQKHRMGLFIRTTGIASARIKIGMTNLAYSFQRLAWLEGQGALAWRENGAPNGDQASKTKEARPKRPALTHKRPRSDPSRPNQAENSPFFEVPN